MSDLQDIVAHNAHRAYQQGVTREQERIIKLAEKHICFSHKTGCDHSGCHALSQLIERIKAEQ